MFVVQHDTSKVVRYASVVIPAVVALGNSGVFSCVTPDDPKERRLIGVYSTMQTKLLQIQVLKVGSVKIVFDSASFAAAQGFLDVDWVFGTALPFQFNVVSVNPGGPAEAANTDEIVVRYETAPDV